MTAAASALYVGEVVHQRFAPVRHRLRYRMFQILVDLDELPELGRRLRLFSHNGFSAFSFHDRDHGDGRSRSLRPYVERVLGEAGIDLTVGRITLLCMPRLLGHVFNPLSIYYCRDAGGALAAMIYEVNNTFGQRHSYVIPFVGDGGHAIRQSCAKGFHVSPFMDMDQTYHFRLTEPGPTIATVVNSRDAAGGPMIHAAFMGRRRAFTDGALLGVLLAYPFLTLGVVAAIHWEAAKLFAKGLRLRRLPPAPLSPISIIAPSE